MTAGGIEPAQEPHPRRRMLRIRDRQRLQHPTQRRAIHRLTRRAIQVIQGRVDHSQRLGDAAGCPVPAGAHSWTTSPRGWMASDLN